MRYVTFGGGVLAYTLAMTHIVAAEFRCLFGTRGLSVLFYVVGMPGLWVGASLSAQDAPVPPNEPIKTLHVYTNTIQLPVLVLDSDRERIRKPIKANRY